MNFFLFFQFYEFLMVLFFFWEIFVVKRLNHNNNYLMGPIMMEMIF